MQLSLLEDTPVRQNLKDARSGTFVDNMVLPVHRWFRYSAGFAAQWVEQILEHWGIGENNFVLDPFAGSATVMLVSDALGIPSAGVEAHPIVARIGKAKLLWLTSPQQLYEFAEQVIRVAQSRPSGHNGNADGYPQLITRSFGADALASLDRLKRSWLYLSDQSPESELVWLALTTILRPTSTAGTAQWQYILPNKTKKRVTEPFLAFRQQIDLMCTDLYRMQGVARMSRAQIIQGDARLLADFVDPKVDAVVTSPPYANNYDYADALRFEMTFWGDVVGWGDIHDAVRKYLIVSSSQHSSRDRLQVDELLTSESVQPIRAELAEVMQELSIVREDHGGKKHYHTMIGAYCRDIGLVLRQLRLVCRPGVRMCWVVGDSAPYGVYCPIDKWIGELALAAGFSEYSFEKLRDRNTKWKNRKHRVPLKEGLLWIEG